MPARKLIDSVGEVGFRVEAVQLGGLNQGVENGGAVAARVGSEKQEVLASDRDAAQQPLGQVVVCALSRCTVLPGGNPGR